MSTPHHWVTAKFVEGHFFIFKCCIGVSGWNWVVSQPYLTDIFTTQLFSPSRGTENQNPRVDPGHLLLFNSCRCQAHSIYLHVVNRSATDWWLLSIYHSARSSFWILKRLSPWSNRLWSLANMPRMDMDHIQEWRAFIEKQNGHF